jgi:hypothetical protein
VKHLREYFHVSDKPVKVVRPGPPVHVDSKWKLLEGAGLTKTYIFDKRDVRDEFIVRCVALETYRGKEDVVWTIDGKTVDVFLKTPQLGLTESIQEFARILDDLRQDLGLASQQDEREEEIFVF